jgi:cytochrome bd-type quinol oxidase subunit 2
MTSNVKAIVKIVATFAALFIFLNVVMIKLNLREAVFRSFLFKEEYKQLTVLIPVGFSILTSYLGYIVARKKGRRKKHWTFICFFLNIWGLIILFFLPSLSGTHRGKAGRC